MIDLNIIPLKSEEISLLRGQGLDKIYDYMSCDGANQFARKMEELRLETFDKLWMTRIDNSPNVMVMAHKIKRDLDPYIYGEFCGSGKMELNPGFMKYLTTCDPLGSYSKQTKLTDIVTIDISQDNIHGTLLKHNIDPEKVVLGYKKRLNNPKNTHLDIDFFRKSFIDRVSLYKVGEYYLIIGFTKKAKDYRRVFEVNDNFIKYLNTIPEFHVDLTNGVWVFPNVPEVKQVNQVISERKTPTQFKIDEILDKISISGISSLTKEELSFMDSIN